MFFLITAVCSCGLGIGLKFTLYKWYESQHTL